MKIKNSSWIYKREEEIGQITATKTGEADK